MMNYPLLDDGHRQPLSGPDERDGSVSNGKHAIQLAKLETRMDKLEEDVADIRWFASRLIWLAVSTLVLLLIGIVLQNGPELLTFL